MDLSIRSIGFPNPLQLVGRLAAVSIAVLSLSHFCAHAIVEPLLPMIRSTVGFLESDFTILGVDFDRDGQSESIRVRANFSHPVYIAGRMLHPMGWDPHTAGWMQVNITLGGVVQYCLLTLILVVAWPAKNRDEFALRLIVALPLMSLSLFVHVPFTILAELWFPIHHDFAPGEFWPLLAWSRFLMGGGGFAIAFSMALASIAIAARRSTKTRRQML